MKPQKFIFKARKFRPPPLFFSTTQEVSEAGKLVFLVKAGESPFFGLAVCLVFF